MMLMAVEMPPGFAIDLYADNVPGARSMAVSPSGVLFVGTRQNGRVYAVVDGDGDGRADTVYTLADGLNMPNGVAFRDGDLYVAEVDRILRFRGIEAHLENPPVPEVVYDDYPKDPRHGWRIVRFGPDGRLYVPVAASCNVCLTDDAVFAAITRMNRDGTGFEIVAHGVRHSMGLDWHPLTGTLWFTDTGPDWSEPDPPSDELNRAGIKGLHFGFPYCHGGRIADPRFGDLHSCGEFTPPAALLAPGITALGMRFYTGRMFPERYHNQLFIAEQGSRNQQTGSGYRITRVVLEGDRVVRYMPFAQGWRINGRVWGRPVDVALLGDGSLLVSDDQNGVIYRITHSSPDPVLSLPPETHRRLR